ncbi:MAG: hypothetical protein CMJ78_03825 [Planctomycetaceae bacterium]|nr:hypothetical protein [Planctomycetaceae bacterium]
MITGRVRHQETVVDLEIINPHAEPEFAEAIVDTGFSGYLTLPRELVNELKLPFVGHRRAVLADGTIVRLEAFLARSIFGQYSLARSTERSFDFPNR